MIKWLSKNVLKLCKKKIKKVKEFFLEHIWRKVLVFVFITPFILQLNPWGVSTWLKSWVRIGTPRDWLGFWSNYLGSILTVAFSYSIAKYETKKQFEHDDKDKFISTIIEFREFLRNKYAESNKLYDLSDTLDTYTMINKINELISAINNVREIIIGSLKFFFIIKNININLNENVVHGIAQRLSKIFTNYSMLSEKLEEIRKNAKDIGTKAEKNKSKYDFEKAFKTFYKDSKLFAKEYKDLYIYISDWLLNTKV